MTEDVIYWESGVDNLFHAWYPVTASYELFNIPTDQTSGLEQYDWMTAESTAKASDGGVSLLFDRHLTKVTIEIASWASEFLESERHISGLKVLNLSEVVTNDGKTTGDQCLVSPYVVREDQTYSVLLAPGTYAPETEIIKFQIGNGKTITGIPSVGRYLDGYIWSGHYHERDDGMCWKDYTFQDGARIYYAKGWNPDGQLIYIGTGALTTSGRVCWRSVYYDTYSGDLKTQDHFPRVTSSFGRGNL